MKHISELVKKFPKKEFEKNPVHELVDFYLIVRGWANKPKGFYLKAQISYSRLCREAKDVLKVFKDDVQEAMRAVDDMSYRAKKQGFSWTLRTLIKKDLRVKL